MLHSRSGKKIKQSQRFRNTSAWCLTSPMLTRMPPLLNQPLARCLILVLVFLSPSFCRQYPIPNLEVSAPNTWGRVIYRKQWIDPNTLAPMLCKQPAGRHEPRAASHPCSRGASTRQLVVPGCNPWPFSSLRYGHTLLLRAADKSLCARSSFPH